jgi:hypothetical protein
MRSFDAAFAFETIVLHLQPVVYVMDAEKPAKERGSACRKQVLVERRSRSGRKHT